MEPSTVSRRPEGAQGRRSMLLFAALAAFVVANLIHNEFGLDPAIAPAALLAGIYWWRPKRALLWGAAFVIALPAFAFFKWSALTDPSGARMLYNHLALLAAGSLAVASVVRSVVPTSSRALHA